MKGKLFSFAMLAVGLTMAGQASALDKVGEVYQIGTAADLTAFAAVVNGGETTAQAVLTANIDLTDVTWTPIGNDGNRYAGTFDGQGFRILNLVAEATGEDFGFFGTVANATIKNVVIDKTCQITSSFNHTAGLIGATNGNGILTIKNCGNEADIIGAEGTGQNNSGILGCNLSGYGITVTFTNCYNTGNITGKTECAAMSGWAGYGSATITNSWNSGTISKPENDKAMVRTMSASKLVNCFTIEGTSHTGCTSFTADDLASGKFCYLLNGDQSEINWYQNLTDPKDATPVPFSTHKQVYMQGMVDCANRPVGGATYTNTKSAEPEVPDHSYEDGICTVCGHASDDYMTATDGYYMIGTAAQLYWFSLKVNEGNNTWNAKLTADINYTGKDAYKTAYIGSLENPYKGTFDGQEHTITIDMTDIRTRVGLFSEVKGGTIKNLIVDGTLTMTSFNQGGGIGGHTDGATLLNLISAVTIKDDRSGDGTLGGLFAVLGGSWTAENCAFVGKMDAPGRDGNGGLCGWKDSNGTFKDCYVSAELNWKAGEVFGRNNPTVTNCTNATDEASRAKLATGELCYQLNGDQSDIKWYQNLTDPKDAYPVPFYTHKKVYMQGMVDCANHPVGGTVYTNTESAEPVIPDHSYGEDGYCTVCGHLGELNEHFMTPTDDDYYLISTAEQLRWFGAMVTKGHSDFCAKLTNNIVYTGNDSYKTATIGSTANPFKGTFDGQGYTLTIDLQEVAGNSEHGLFPKVDGATIKNLVVNGKFTQNTTKCTGGLGGVINGKTTIQNVISAVTITDKQSGDGTIGGLFGVAASGEFLIENCAFVGKIDAAGRDGSGGLIGWSYYAGKISNSYVAAELIWKENSNNELYARNQKTLVNCADKNMFGADELATGELAYTLNLALESPVWFQNLTDPKDAYPVPFDTHNQVYAQGSVDCGNRPVGEFVYTNTEATTPVIPPHDFGGNAFCPVCGAINGEYMTAVDGCFEISTAQQLQWFAAYVNNYGPADAKLMNDIDMTGYPSEPIGIFADGKKYNKTFDGQGYTIDNLLIEKEDADYVGFFGCLDGGAVLKNFVIGKGSSIKGKAFVGGIAGGSNGGGEINFYNLGNEGSVSGSAQNAAGFVGCNVGGTKWIVENCYNAGTVYGGRESGVITGWAADAYFTNVWNSGSISTGDGYKDFTRGGNGSKCKNNYTSVDVYIADHATKIDPSEVSSGKLCYNLNGGNFGTNFYQDVENDEHPTINPASGVVCYVGTTGYATGVTQCKVLVPADDMILTVSKVEGGTVFVDAVAKNTTLAEGTPVLINYDIESYISVPVSDAAATTPANILKGSATEAKEVAAEGDIYILVDDGEGNALFVPSMAGTLAAGKAYIDAADVPAGAKALRIGGTTNIKNVEVIATDNVIYDLTGRRVINPQGGIYIVNGKKMVIE